MCYVRTSLKHVANSDSNYGRDWRATMHRCSHPLQDLHLWRRELYGLLPYLRATEVKCGWLLKRGETASAGFKKRWARHPDK